MSVRFITLFVCAVLVVSDTTTAEDTIDFPKEESTVDVELAEDTLVQPELEMGRAHSGPLLNNSDFEHRVQLSGGRWRNIKFSSATPLVTLTALQNRDWAFVGNVVRRDKSQVRIEIVDFVKSGRCSGDFPSQATVTVEGKEDIVGKSRKGWAGSQALLLRKGTRFQVSIRAIEQKTHNDRCNDE